MRPINVILNPRDFLIEDYAPGLTIDFRQRSELNRAEKFSRLFLYEGTSEASSDGEIEKAVGISLHKLQLAEDPADF